METGEDRIFHSVDELVSACWPNEPPDSDFYRSVTTSLRELEKLVSSAIGEPVLVIHRHESFQGCVGFGYRPRAENYTVGQTFLIGIVQEPGLLLKASGDRFPRVEITVKKHVWAGDAMIDHGVCTDAGNIPGNPHLPVTGWKGLNARMRLRNPLTAWKPVYTEVVAGREAVCAWAKKHHHELFLREAFRELGYTVASPVIGERIAKERTRHANALESLWIKRVILRERIERLTNVVVSGEHWAWKGAVDARIVTHKDREELEDVERDLRQHLTKLAEYGVDDTTPNIHLVRHLAGQLGINLEL